MRRAIFLDRDGTLNEDAGYVHRRKDWRWLPGSLSALERLAGAGFLLVVASNQSGIARGLFSEDDVRRLHRSLDRELSRRGIRLAGWYCCPHLPEISGPCPCRKPAPGLLLQAASELDIDLGASWMVGDRWRDAEAGCAAGCQTVLLASAPPEELAMAQGAGVRIVPDLAGAAELILASHSGSNIG